MNKTRPVMQVARLLSRRGVSSTCGNLSTPCSRLSEYPTVTKYAFSTNPRQWSKVSSMARELIESNLSLDNRVTVITGVFQPILPNGYH
jgi:hypothetical protein